MSEDNILNSSVMQALIHSSVFNSLQSKTKIEENNLAKLLLLIITLIGAIIFMKFGPFLSMLIFGGLYPAYRTLKVINDAVVEESDRELFLAYWVIYAVYISTLKPLLFAMLKKLPFNFLVEVAFFIWLYHHKSQGANLIYNKLIKPIISKYGDVVSNRFSEIEERFNKKK